MRTQFSISSCLMKNKLTICALLAFIALGGGCNKSEPAAPAASTPPQAAKPPQAQPSEVSVKPTQPPTNVTVSAEKPKITDQAAGLAQQQVASQPASPAVAEKVASISAAPTPAPSTSQAPVSVASLSQDQVVRGLQEALARGLQQAVTNLGHSDGFLTNLQVKIPLPEKLQKVETVARDLKQEKLVDDFVSSMNRAAEQAVPAAATVFANALSHMTIEDAKSILSGPNDAATKYFQAATQTNLYEKFYPIVKQATASVGVTSAYKNLMEKVNAGGLTQKLGGLGSLGSAISGSLLDQNSMDIDAYVTNKAMDGLFKMVAQEEQKIRQNPVARTTELLQKVFGAVKN
jgi:hypothetical protein